MTQTTSITTEYQITVSSPVWQKVEQIAGEFNLSVSELLEQIGEGQLKVIAVPSSLEKLSDRDIANYFIWLASPTNVAIDAYLQAAKTRILRSSLAFRNLRYAAI